MLIVMRHGASRRGSAQRVCDVIAEMGYQARPMPGRQRTTVGLVGNDGRVDGSRIAALPGVAEVIHVSKPYKQVSREWKPEPTIVSLPGGLRDRRRRGGGHGGALLGRERGADPGRRRAVRAAGATVLRAGAFKPRTSPYSFQGLGATGSSCCAGRERPGC